MTESSLSGEDLVKVPSGSGFFKKVLDRNWINFESAEHYKEHKDLVHILTSPNILGRISTSLGNTTDYRKFSCPEDLSQEVFGLNFPSPLISGAGIVKNLENLDQTVDYMFSQGFGGIVVGSFSFEPREGNFITEGKEERPFFRCYNSIPTHFHNSFGVHGSGVNAVADVVKKLKKPKGKLICSLYVNDLTEDNHKSFNGSIKKLKNYFDIFELNLSCPSVEHLNSVEEQLTMFSKLVKFDNFPVVAKLPIYQGENLTNSLDVLMKFGVAGVVLGNSSKNIDIPSASDECKSFREKYKDSGVSGNILTESSFNSCIEALGYLQKSNSSIEVIRSGGAFSGKELERSWDAGINLIQGHMSLLKKVSSKPPLSYNTPGPCERVISDYQAIVERKNLIT